MTSDGDAPASRAIRRKSAGRATGERRPVRVVPAERLSPAIKPGSPEDELVTVTALPTALEAEMARMRLESEGIPAVIADAYVTQLAGPLGGGWFVRLQVRRRDVFQAADALGIPWERTELEAADDPEGSSRELEPACPAPGRGTEPEAAGG